MTLDWYLCVRRPTLVDTFVCVKFDTKEEADMATKAHFKAGFQSTLVPLIKWTPGIWREELLRQNLVRGVVIEKSYKHK